jgi:glycosyltransferase involved in cell wall biosynthesis
LKISILLPFKENFSPSYAGAVSLFIKDTLRVSLYKNNCTVYGNTLFKKKFNLKYKNINLKKGLFLSQNKKYVEKFINIEKKNNSDLIELHNRPIYLTYLINKLKNRTYILYFHNDPLSMSGSKTISDRMFLLNNCFKIVFNSKWSKRRFLEGLNSIYFISEKLIVINQSAKKNKINIKKKQKLITFVGKLNKSKGYDLFGASIIQILNKHNNWNAIVAGDEPRDKLNFYHKKLKILGFKPHNEILNIYKKTSIAVVCSRWEEPFGRSSLEAAANGCAVIISNRGGLPETITDGIILKKLDIKNICKEIEKLIINDSLRHKIQYQSYKNFYLTNKFVSNQVDKVRSEKFKVISFNIKKINKSLRIVHVTNFNERFDGRLFFNTGKRINNGFVRLGHSVLEFSDRDIQKHYKSYSDFTGSKTLNAKLINICENYRPDLIVLGHADLISLNILRDVKNKYPNTYISQWFLDPLIKNGPDYAKNKKRILDKYDVLDGNFITTSPDTLSFLDKKNNIDFFIPNPVDPSFETLNNFDKDCEHDVFFALSHGVHRGTLKGTSVDGREKFINNLIKKTNGVKYDIYGMNNIQPIWADQYLKTISNSKMGLNLSRGVPQKYYSSDRLTQIIGNGLLALIDEKTNYRDFFEDDEMVFYKNISDLSEKILKLSKDDYLRKKIAKKGKLKYMKYFNSTLVAEFIINKTFNINNKKFYWN